MTELEKIQRAKMYIDKLANGIDPITDMKLDEDTVLNNIRLSRCFFYVSEILGQVISDGDFVGSVKQDTKKSTRRKNEFFITEEELQNIELSDSPIAISQLKDLICIVILDDKRKKLSATKITKGLVERGFLEIITTPEGTNKKVPTDMGIQLGITVESRTSYRGDYDINLYDKRAQKFILDHLSELL